MTIKCMNCNGSGKVENRHGYPVECPFCGGSGKIKKVEQTNEEWLDRKSTKEKAEWLFKLTYKCYWCGREYTPRSLSLYNEKECPFKKCMKDKKDFEKWLKQPHKGET